MYSKIGSSTAQSEVEIMLDGVPLKVPAERRSLNAIRSYLDTLALSQQRVLCCFLVDGHQVNRSGPHEELTDFARIEGQTMDLECLPFEMIKMALQQTIRAQDTLTSVIEKVLINDGCVARELWWNLARHLNEPLISLSFINQPGGPQAEGGASIAQLRKWQLQQLAAIIRDVDEACWSANSMTLVNALENRVMPWLRSLRSSLELWHETLLTNPVYA
jgi:hypothetical protein